MLFVFSPFTMKSAADDEMYYNKLPDYYVGPFSSTKGLKQNDVTEKENNRTYDNEPCYDKIPSYFTELRENGTQCNSTQNLTVEKSDDAIKSSRGKCKLKQMEERRVIYVGNVSHSTTLNDLRERFAKFGPIDEVKLHFREVGDSYGFVTFVNKHDAVKAIQYGNEDPSLPKYDLCFGGRRHFCQNQYADLDATAEEESANKKIQPIL